MDYSDLYAKSANDLNDRTQWETRQRQFYEMRHHGLRRKTKPWPGASDAHFPLSDTIITNLKPYYVQQLFALDTVASFVSLKQQQAALTTAASQWMDYRLKQRSNLQTEIISTIDTMLLSGRGILKTTYDLDKNQLNFENVDPMHLIVPSYCKDIESADRVTHIQHYSPDSYRRKAGFKQDEKFIERVTGGNGKDRGDDNRHQIAKQREGVVDDDSNIIVIWETYVQNDDKTWTIYTYCPSDLTFDVRPPMEVPYNHGKPPFVSCQYEHKDTGWYSPRGVTELVAVFEASLSKLLNEKSDTMSLYNRPLFRSSRALPNTANLRFQPGQILPEDIQPIPMPSPPISFDQHMMMHREMAQQRVSTPDFGISQTLDNNQRRTATEISAIGNLFTQSADLRMRTFRLFLGDLYRQCWSLLTQFDSSSLNYYYLDTLEQIPQSAIHEAYDIVPSGSADGVNKQFHFQKAVARFQMFANDPHIDQVELRRSVLEADDSGLVKRLLTDPGIEVANQAEDQAVELSVMKIGFPAQVKPSDDHATHVKTMLDYLALKRAQNAQTDPIELQRIQEHITAHMEQYREQDGKAAQQLTLEIQEVSNAINEANPVDAPIEQNGSGGIQPGVDSGGSGTVAPVPQQPGGAET
jgi:hypothetical protein